MLVLSRKVGETIVVPDCDLTITVVQVRGNRVRLGLCAPEDVTIDREEISKRRSSNGAEVKSHALPDVTRVTRHPR
jgi:carbon storage regulator